MRYGDHARTSGIFFSRTTSSSLGSTDPIHWEGQRWRGANSQVSLGWRKPARAADTTMRRPMRAPSIDGNSGPRNFATSR